MTLHRAFYDIAQRLRGEPVAEVRRELQASRTQPPEALLELQWQRQRAMLRHAWSTTAWYRQRMQEMGVQPEDVKTRDDWNALPVVEKADLQARGAEFRSSRGSGGQTASTSGSSGTPVTVLRSQRSWAHAHANMIEHMAWHGIEWGEPHAYFWGVPLDPAARRNAHLRDALFNRRRCSAFDLDDDLAADFYARRMKDPCTYALGYPSAVTRFAVALESRGLDGRALGWKAVITTAEVLHAHQRERISRVLGCPVADTYGCAEIGMVGVECERTRLHVPVESVAVDFIENEEGHVELLLTDLHNGSQPMIRYRVGDLLQVDGAAAEAAAGGLLPAPACACGRPLPVLPGVTGRAGDTLELPDGRRVNANLPSYIFKKHGKADTIREYQFVQFPAGRIALRIVTGPNWRNGMEAELNAEVRRVLGIETELEIVPRIERRGRGKHRDFIRAEGT